MNPILATPKRPILAIPILAALAILAISILACTKASTESIRKYTLTPTITLTPSVTPSDTGTPIPSLTPDRTPPPFPYSATVISTVAVRLGPGEEFGRVRYLDQGDTVKILGLSFAADGGTWAQIDGGYVNNKFLSKK